MQGSCGDHNLALDCGGVLQGGAAGSKATAPRDPGGVAVDGLQSCALTEKHVLDPFGVFETEGLKELKMLK